MFFFTYAGPSRNSKKRNLSVNESSSVPIKKKAKVESSQACNEKSKLATEAKNRGCSRSLQKITKKQSSSTKSKQKKADTDLLTNSVVKQQMIKEEVKQEKSIEDKNKSPFKYNNKKLPQNLVVSPRKERNVKKTLDLDSAEGTAQPCAIKQEAESTLSEDSDSDNEGVAWEDVDGRYLLKFNRELKKRHFIMVNFSLKIINYESMNCCHKSNDSLLDKSLEITLYVLLLSVAQKQLCSLACMSCR